MRVHCLWWLTVRGSLDAIILLVFQYPLSTFLTPPFSVSNNLYSKFGTTYGIGHAVVFFPQLAYFFFIAMLSSFLFILLKNSKFNSLYGGIIHVCAHTHAERDHILFFHSFIHEHLSWFCSWPIWIVAQWPRGCRYLLSSFPLAICPEVATIDFFFSVLGNLHIVVHINLYSTQEVPKGSFFKDIFKADHLSNHTILAIKNGKIEHYSKW